MALGTLFFGIELILRILHSKGSTKKRDKPNYRRTKESWHE